MPTKHYRNRIYEEALIATELRLNSLTRTQLPIRLRLFGLKAAQLRGWMKPTTIAGLVALPFGLFLQAVFGYQFRFGAGVSVGALVAQGLGFSLLSASALKAVLIEFYYIE